MRDTTPNFEPHLSQYENGDWYVRMKQGLGQYVVLWSRDHAGKYSAAKALRNIRRELAQIWFEQRRKA